MDAREKYSRDSLGNRLRRKTPGDRFGFWDYLAYNYLLSCRCLGASGRRRAFAPARRPGTARPPGLEKRGDAAREQPKAKRASKQKLRRAPRFGGSTPPRSGGFPSAARLSAARPSGPNVRHGRCVMRQIAAGEGDRAGRCRPAVARTHCRCVPILPDFDGAPAG